MARRVHRQGLLVAAVAVAAFAAAAIIVWWWMSARTSCADIAAVEHLEPDTVSMVPCVPAFLVVDRLGNLSVFLAASPHLINETLEWDPRERLFVSPAHGETFDVNGKRLAGPASRDMFRCESAIRNGWVVVTVEDLPRPAPVRYDCDGYSAFVDFVRSRTNPDAAAMELFTNEEVKAR